MGGDRPDVRDAARIGFPAERAGFRERVILLGVTGGIAAYKAAFLASHWTQRGARVRVFMTPAACRFVTPLTFETLTRQPVHDDIWRTTGAEGGGSGREHRPEHVDATEDGELFVIAPATADFIARAAHGLASDALTLALLAFSGPVLVAPAMNDRMWASPVVRENLDTLRRRGVGIIAPGTGHLACGSHGAGRLADLTAIDDACAEILCG